MNPNTKFYSDLVNHIRQDELHLETFRLSELVALENMVNVAWDRHDRMHETLYNQYANRYLTELVTEDMVNAAYNLAIAYQQNYFRLYADMHECSCTPIGSTCPTCVARIRSKSTDRESLDLI